LVGADIGEEVQARVKKSEKAKHAAEADELRQMEKFAERGDGQGEDEKAQDPVTGGMLNELDGIGAQAGMKSAPGQSAKRHEAEQEENNFGPLAGEKFAHALIRAQ
jgi:hypothetical protein